MTQLTLAPPLAADRGDLWDDRAVSERAEPCRDRTPAADLGGEPTLDALLSGVWEGLVARRSVPCPVCGGELIAIEGAHARPVGGRCRSCASEFS